MYALVTQRAQNKVLTLLENSKISDSTSSKDMLAKQELLSANQTFAQIKLTEAQKASREEEYPVKMNESTQ